MAKVVRRITYEHDDVVRLRYQIDASLIDGEHCWVEGGVRIVVETIEQPEDWPADVAQSGGWFDEHLNAVAEGRE